jgi:hypothetical protein
MGVSPWISTGISGVAAAVSVAALTVSVAANRAAGPRVSILNSKLSGSGTDLWLNVKISNSGRSEIDVDGAWTGWFGPTTTTMPISLRGGSSAILTFIATFPDKGNLDIALSVQIELGNGQSMLKRLALSEREVAYELGRIGALREQYRNSASYRSDPDFAERTGQVPGEPVDITTMIEEV